MVAPLPIEAATIGWADSLILMLLALIVFGPRKLPQLGRQMGKLMYEFRKASNDFKFQMEEELRSAEESDRRKREEAERQRQLALNPPLESSAAEAAPATAEAPVPDDANNPYSGYSEYVKEQEQQTDASAAGTTPAEIIPAGNASASAENAPAAAEVAPATTETQALSVETSTTEPVERHG